MTFLTAVQDPGCRIEKVSSWFIQNRNFSKWVQHKSKGIREFRIFARVKKLKGINRLEVLVRLKNNENESTWESNHLWFQSMI